MPLLVLWHEFSNLHLRKLSEVSDVVHSFNLLKMQKVMSHPQVIVIVHLYVQGLHGFTSGSAFGHGTIDSVLGLHELVVLSFDSVNNVWGVNAALVAGPVYGGQV